MGWIVFYFNPLPAKYAKVGLFFGVCRSWATDSVILPSRWKTGVFFTPSILPSRLDYVVSDVTVDTLLREPGFLRFWSDFSWIAFLGKQSVT